MNGRSRGCCCSPMGVPRDMSSREYSYHMQLHQTGAAPTESPISDKQCHHRAIALGLHLQTWTQETHISRHHNKGLDVEENTIDYVVKLYIQI
jgi:hypothetical protein